MWSTPATDSRDISRSERRQSSHSIALAAATTHKHDAKVMIKVKIPVQTTRFSLVYSHCHGLPQWQDCVASKPLPFLVGGLCSSWGTFNPSR